MFGNNQKLNYQTLQDLGTIHATESVLLALELHKKVSSNHIYCVVCKDGWAGGWVDCANAAQRSCVATLEAGTRFQGHTMRRAKATAIMPI
eukprot:2905992-Amphidinium_carterae.1